LDCTKTAGEKKCDYIDKTLRSLLYIYIYITINEQINKRTKYTQFK